MGRVQKCNPESAIEARRIWYEKNRAQLNARKNQRNKDLPEDAKAVIRFKELKRYHQGHGSVLIENDVLVKGLEYSPIPTLPDGTYEWETIRKWNNFTAARCVKHKLTVSGFDAVWQITIPGCLGVRGDMIHIIGGPEATLVANCRVNPDFVGQLDDLISYFEWFVTFRATLPNFGFDDQVSESDGRISASDDRSSASNAPLSRDLLKELVDAILSDEELIEIDLPDEPLSDEE